MGDRVSSMNYESAQRYISESPWDEQPLLCEVARQADRLLGGQAESALYLDETGFAKKGQVRSAWRGNTTGDWARWITPRSWSVPPWGAQIE